MRKFTLAEPLTRFAVREGGKPAAPRRIHLESADSLGRYDETAATFTAIRVIHGIGAPAWSCTFTLPASGGSGPQTFYGAYVSELGYGLTSTEEGDVPCITALMQRELSAVPA